MKIHFIGIGGIGMSGLAKMLLMQNHEISGSDIAKNDIIIKLQEMGALIHLEQRKENVPHQATVVVSTDIKQDNPELIMAKELGLPILHRSDLLNLISKDKFSLAVAGTHGKTTTSTLLVQVLQAAQLEPSFAVGGIIKELKSNAHLTSSSHFIFEACESDGTLVKYHPQGAIITNIDNDHLDHYKTFDNLKQTFAQFASQTKDNALLFVHGDETIPHQGIKYGFAATNDLIASNLRLIDQSYLFDISFKGIHYYDVRLNSPLEHNVLNALAVFGLSLSLDISEEVIRSAFAAFSPPKKRLEIKYNDFETLFIDDYGHHPCEIASTLKSIRKAWPHHRIITLFQPHRYSRIKECMTDFKSTFNDTDLLYLTEIYSAGEKPVEGVTSDKLKSIIEKDSNLVSRKQLAQTLFPNLRPFDLVISFGAGDISKIHDELLSMGTIAPLKVALIYGGKSVEHEISCKSSQHILKGLSQKIFTPVQLYVDKEGFWHHDEKISFGKAIDLLESCDVAFPMMHGKFGEDGPFHGMFEILDIPYVGGPFSFHAISMDKGFSKIITSSQNIATSPFVILKKDDPRDLDLNYPLFVKPVHLGSSIGIRKVHSPEELNEAIDYAFKFDTKLVVEEQIIGREIEYVVLEEKHGTTAFHPGEILTHGEVYSYEAKYHEGGFKTATRADLSPELAKKGALLAEQIFSLLDGRGYARVDFFLDAANKFWFNEINPIPGFTNISLMPLIADANGYPIEKLVSHLVSLSLHHSRQEKRLSNSFDLRCH